MIEWIAQMIWDKGKRLVRVTAFLLSAVLTCMAVFPYFPVLPTQAGNGETVVLTTAHGDYGGDHKLYCIDTGAYAFWGIADDGDVYERHRPSALSLSLTQKEQEYVFWGLLTLQASLGIRQACDVVTRIRIQAQEAGKEPITNFVTEHDLKALIYSAKVREKYPWLETVAAHTEEYLRMGGLLQEGAGVFPSGKQVPSFLSESTSISKAYMVNSSDFVLSFDETGADAEFIHKVPILFSNDNGMTFQPEPTDGWLYQKTDTEIRFMNPNPNPPRTLLRFAAEETEFASVGGYASEKELFEECLQIWECKKCSGNHQGGTPPLSETWHHQRMVWMEFEPANVGYYAVLGGGASSGLGTGDLSFAVFRHEEEFRSHYNVRLQKYDYETGKALSGSRFALYERFDDAGCVDRKRDGAETLYEGGEPYAGGYLDSVPVWSGFRNAASVVTDEEGMASQTIEHGYHYDKTFCNGHPAPVFCAVPEEEEDEETGELLNEDAIAEAQAQNQRLALEWLSCEADCEEKAGGDFSGVHFHWILPGVDVDMVNRISASGGSPGREPDAGEKTGADGEAAFEESGCRIDRDKTYERFISMRYSYVWQEFQARDGYIQHGLHADDLPIEVITTDASEHGANAAFAGSYDLEKTKERVSLSSHETPSVRAARKTEAEFVFLDEEATGSELVLASPSESAGKKASSSELSLKKASPSEFSFAWNESKARFRKPAAKSAKKLETALFLPAYEAACVSSGVGEARKAEADDKFSHCNGTDGEEDAWEIYDHRTEGEFHINKKDLDLAAAETEGYQAYGDTQGDAVLEGAVYGLFAASDLIHPDGKTGVVYQAGDLTAVTTTDQNGDASFLVYTQAPGRTYDYETGSVVVREGGWAERAPGNLYQKEYSEDDYTADSCYERSYSDLEEQNGNCWIGRPLLLGEYYVKELSRSEGYELSIGRKGQTFTNAGQNLEAGVLDNPSEGGYAAIVNHLSAEEQTSEDGQGAGPNELFFTTESEDTGKTGYVLELSGLPKGASFYRKEVGTVVFETETGTGIWEKKLCCEEDGTPIYLRAEHAFQYPKYQENGELLTNKRPASLQADFIRQVTVRPIKEETIRKTLLESDADETQEELQAYLQQPFKEEELLFVKEKVETVLRRNKKTVAKAGETADGYALPIQKLYLPKEKEDGTPLTIADAIVQILSFYDSHPYYSCGGMESAEEEGTQFAVTLTASVSGHPEYFMVPGENEEDSLIFHRIVWTPEDPELPKRYAYVSYSRYPSEETFGTYEAYQSSLVGAAVVGSAVLLPDAVAKSDGSFEPKYVEETVYYQPGELVRDASGSLIQKFEYKEQTKKQIEEKEEVRWKPCDASCQPDGTYRLFVQPEYTDSFGSVHTDDGKMLQIEWKAVLKEKEKVLSEEEAKQLGNGFFSGHTMNSASYYVRVKKARVRTAGAVHAELFGEDSFVIPVSLSYPGQQKVWQDAGSRSLPGQVYERVIRQKIRINKEVPDTVRTGFRFKLYLRSNLERLYRNEAGEITWLTRAGKEQKPEQAFPGFENEALFAEVPKLYTKAEHCQDSQTTGPVSNNVFDAAMKVNSRLYSFDENGWISETPNAGYTRLLETLGTAEQTDSAVPAGAAVYHYEKFFDAIRTANHDKWDLGEEKSTSYQPFPLISAASAEAKENQKVSDAVRQFAINWYLKEEVTKRTEETESGIRQTREEFSAYQKEIYEKALREAIQKAENYLKPFFLYDLDEIYAVEWDAAPGGGSDGDRSTLSVEEKEENMSYGSSKYLPYGIYVAVEQQPEIWKKGDFGNRHYSIDAPKEILVPSCYEKEEIYDSAYVYHAKEEPEKLAAAYQIRMNEEWGSTNQADERAFVISAQNQDGAFEVYPYGLAARRRSGVIHTPNGARSYAGFSFYQGSFTPQKAFYEEEAAECAGAYHKNAAVGRYYRYGLVSEQSGTLLGTPMITGSLTGYDGSYFPALVPKTVLESEAENSYAEKTYRNQPYRARLRLEKLDAETGEEILHDGALFTIYRAQREEAADGTGMVKFYEEDTLLVGSREFLEAMGATEIRPIARKILFWELPSQGRCYGTVPAGTPICREEDRVVQLDETGNKTGSFQAYTTVRDGAEGNQTVGYLETPKPLEAGCYVLCEMKAPAGYVRNKPIAVELYSDEVSYYLDGKKESRVLSACYENRTSAQIYVNNMPIRLEITKGKPQEETVSYELNGRLEGSIPALTAAYGKENLEFAYNHSGKYLGYGWKKGFLDSLEKRKRFGEPITLLYENGVFSGKALLTYPVKQEENPYLPGAWMTLYEGIEVKPSGDREDFRYAGVHVVRDRQGNVENIYVEKGYAGQKVCCVLEKNDPNHPQTEDLLAYAWNQELNDSGNGVWIVQTIEREDTDILFYDLSDLTLKMESEKQICAYKDGKRYLELVSSQPGEIHYRKKDKVFTKVPDDVKVYHLDSEGIRDSMVDPYTGMAYVREEETGKYMVWPVKVSRDSFGNLIAREKIKTSRPASVFADTEQEYTIGSWNGTAFEKQVNPVLDEYGRPIYYPRSSFYYQKGYPVYDRDGDYVRYRYEDRLHAFNWNAWEILEESRLFQTGKESFLFHRQGEAYLIENTWYTGEAVPNAPVRSKLTDGKADLLKRVPAGIYILEELRAPSGYVKAMPSGLTVEETTQIQKKRVVDVPIRAVFEKTDEPAQWSCSVLDVDQVLDGPVSRIEGKGSYTYRSVKGAQLALYAARKNKKGEWVKKSEAPFSYSLPGENTKITAKWVSGETPKYFEKLPKGTYRLEETEAPPGFLPAQMTVEIRETEALQAFRLPNDHTKIEILKYLVEEDKTRPASNSDGAVLALYAAACEEDGSVKTDELGRPMYQETHCLDQWTATDCREYLEGKDSFLQVYEALYEEYGSAFATLSWISEGMEKKAVRIQQEETKEAESVRQMWRTEDGKQILIAVSRGGKEDGSSGFSFDYKFNYCLLKDKDSPFAVSYDTVYGTHRLDYVNCSQGKSYVLVEVTAPAGCKKAEPRLIQPKETAEIQLYTMKNEPGYLEIWKVTEGEEPLPGAELALYRADRNGTFVQEEEFLVDRWISDTKPHRISSLAEGSYYLAELAAPKGFVPMQPKQIQVGQDTPVCIKAENERKKGRLELLKVDAEQPGQGLEGAVYELQNLDTGECWKLATDADGKVQSPLLLTGSVQNGSWVPYRFLLQEEKPPLFHALDRNKIVFSFKDEAPFADEQETILLYRKELCNAPTKIKLSKTDFGTDSLLSGARLAVYAAEMQNGSYHATGNALERWISDGTPHTICGKLTAGEMYLLVEEEAPQGYVKREPQLFSLSEDGIQIAEVSSVLGMLKFQLSEEFPDQIKAVSVWGRKALRSRRILTELESGKELILPVGSSSTVKAEDGIREDTLYEEREETYFSDGKSAVTDRRIFRMKLTGDSYTPVWRIPEQTELTLWKKTENGEEKIAGWNAESTEQNGYLYTIWNPEYEERNGISAVGKNGALGNAVLPGSVLHYEVCCANTGNVEKKMRVNVLLDKNESWMPATSDSRFSRNGALLTAELLVKPGTEERLRIAAAVASDAKEAVSVKASINGQEYTETHPVAASGTVTLLNRVKGTGAASVDRTFTYQVTFWSANGEKLKTEQVCLKKNEGITFQGLPWGTVCCAEEQTESRQDSELEFSSLSEGKGEVILGKMPETIRFSYEKTDGSHREVLQKNTDYVLREETVYSDGTILQTGTQSFSLDEKGAVTKLEITNQKTELHIEKRDAESGKRMDGAKLQLFLEEGEEEILLETWNSAEKEAHLIQHALSPGDHLILREKQAPPGYGIAEDIRFAIPQEGGLLTVCMEDKPIHVKIQKLALSRDNKTILGPLAGAVIRIEEENGTLVYRFETGADGIEELPLILEAGKTYRAVEESAPFGYELAEPVSFTISEEGEAVFVLIYDREKETVSRKEKSETPKISKTPTEGLVTVQYDEFLEGTALLKLPYQRLKPLPATGEEGTDGLRSKPKAFPGERGLAAAGLLVLLMILVTAFRKESEKRGDEENTKES